MQLLIHNNLLLESDEVHGNTYGTSFDAIREVQTRDQIPLFDLSADGILALKHHFGADCVTFGLLPPQHSDLETRLDHRGSETVESKATRLNNATETISNLQSLKESGSLDHLIVRTWDP